jgi:hypothetical protein
VKRNLLLTQAKKICVLGKTCSGKSTFLRNLMIYRNFTFKEPPTRIINVYQYVQDWFDDLSDIVEFVQTPPTDIAANEHNFLIFDDSTESMFEDIASWFLRSARHTKTTIVFVYQTIFNSKYDAFKRIVNNTDIFIFTFMPKNRYQLGIFFRQFFASKEKTREALELYNEAMRLKYGYLLFDARQGMPHQFRTNIFCENDSLETAYTL